MKLQELARDLNISGKEILQLSRENHIFLKSLSSKIDPQREKLLRQAHQRKRNKQSSTEFPNVDKDITLNKELATVSELSEKFEVTIPILMKLFLSLGQLYNINSELDRKMIERIASALNIRLTFDLPNKTDDQSVKDVMLKIEEQEIEDHLDQLKTRPPIITIMGHVDHGKTLLLDTIRQSDVIAGESGGITQHIGAYQVLVQDKALTFLDTPGHEAFTTLRARGAQVTDIAILVVSADEGIKPQTKEAIDHANAANIPILVAINKIDLPNANVEACKQSLTELGLTPEDWGGKTIMMPVSAKTKQGVDDLLEMLLLLAETLELQAVFEGPAKGVVIESHLSSTRGPLSTLLIKSGSLKVGDTFVAGGSTGKVRALFDDHGKNLSVATPGMPVEILGFSSVAEPGQLIQVYENEKLCLKHAESWKLARKNDLSHKKISLETLSSGIQSGEQTLFVILKADVHGSLEALKSSISRLSTETVKIQVIHDATGAVTLSDVTLAKASNAFIFAFNVNATPEAVKKAQEFDIQLKTYSIIYDIIDDLTRVTKGLYKSIFVDVEVGRAEVRELFHFSKVGSIAGCMVTSGMILRRGSIHVERKGDILHKGKILALRRFKEDAKEVKKNFECGITLEKYDDIQKGDILICYIQEEQKP
ncbi:MAG: translation initiation factor IF-2 [bacterium]